MKVTRFHHVSVNTNGVPVDDVVAFYKEVLQLDDRERPDIPGIAGHWHSVGDQELHLVGAEELPLGRIAMQLRELPHRDAVLDGR